MTAIAPPPVTAAVALGPISQIIPAQYRLVGDDWAGEMAFLFTFYTVLPTFDETTGAVTSPGQVRDLTGCTFSGTVSYAPPYNPFRKPLLWDPSPVPMEGQIDVGVGQGVLTLPKAQTNFRPQSYELWQPSQQGFERDAMLEVRARLTDPLGFTTTQGIVPLFVF